MSHLKLSDYSNEKKSPSCYLVGQDNLLVECAKILLARSFSIVGVISPSNHIRAWMQQQGITCFHSLSEINWEATSADYLFSIVNNEIIPPFVLKQIRRLAINYHDGPLPRYAGANAASWAIIHGESSHAVTWHVINECIDGGRILKQHPIPLHPDESAMSLNFKCAEQAIVAFSKLVDELINESYHLTQQDLAQRSYFARSKKPVNNGWINWDSSAEQIVQLFRATQFGLCRNPFATTKIVLGNEAFVVEALTRLSSNSGQTPGSVIKKTQSYWQIATKTNTVMLSSLSTMDGKPVELNTLASRYDIAAGTQLVSPSVLDGELLLKLSQDYFPYEAYWVEKLRYFQPNTGTSEQAKVNLQNVPIALNDHLLHFGNAIEDAPMVLLAVWLVYLRRIDGHRQLNIFVNLGNSLAADHLPFFTTHLPFSITINDYKNFNQLVEQVRRECQQIRQHGSYLRDCWYRYPELAESIANDTPGYHVTLGDLTYQGVAEDILPKPFLTLCEELLDHSHRPISEIDWITQQERQQLLIEWNATDTPYPAHKTIHGLFEEQVERTPHHLALVAQDARLTYQELNNRANQLAHYLIANRSIQPDQLIAVFLERSQWMSIALLGILKSSAAYVPLDPDYPANQVEYILNETNTRVVVTTKTHVQQLRSLPNIDWKKNTLLVLDDPDFLLTSAQQSTVNPVTTTSSRNLSYVMYTSGTTGQPKGIQIEHRGIVNQITWMNRTYPLRPTDKVLQRTSYVFDISVWELFRANLYGATVVFAKKEGHREPNYLIRLIESEQVSVIQFTPSMLNEFIYELANKKNHLSSLRHIFCAGEVLDVMTVNIVHLLLPHAIIHNLYGPTEASINMLSYDCIDQQTAFIGKPIANTRVYVLDEQLRLLPVGASGELYIGGVGLARGYLNKAELTSQKFIPNPFQTEQDKRHGQYDRLYKTGDMVRWLTSGNLDFLGRYDTQTKLRGYRIELSGIEQILHRYPGIQQSVVRVVDNQLVAYYVARQAFDPIKLSTYVAELLPEYMVPNQFIYLEKLPLTISGKVDQKKLPLPVQPIEHIFQPRNSIEATIAGVFAAVLDLEQTVISTTDDFFRLGGDSILAIRLVSRLNELFQQKIQVRDVLQLKTIQALSALVEGSKSASQQTETPYKPFSLIDTQQYQDIINPQQIEDIYPASHLQMGLLLESSLSEQGTYHDVYFYEINLLFNEQKFLAVWEALTQKHDLLRARFLFSDQHALDVAIFKQARLHYRYYEDQPLQQIIDAERLTNFLHTEESLFHLIVNRHVDKFEFIFSFHHAIVDGWSVASLINEFVQAYAHSQAIVLGFIPQHDAVPRLSYGEFVRNELSHLDDRDSMSFWKSYLADSEPAQAKWKFEDTATSPDSLFTSAFSLTPDEAKLAHQLARERAISVDTVFLYAYLKTLSFFLNSDDITIGVVFNNRLEKRGGDTLFGLFLNVLPFRLQLNQYSSVPEALTETFATKMKLYTHKLVPYAHLKSNFKRDLYKFGFNFVHYHVLKPSAQIIINSGGFGRTSIPLVLEVTQGDSFKVELKAHDNYISQQYLHYFVHYLQVALQNILHNKNELSLDAHDYQRMIVDWNTTQQRYPHEKTLHQLFEEQVKKTPHAIALVYEGKQLTYQRLNHQANQLAHHLLRQYQVKPDELIALCLDRNELTLIAILAVLKSGAAYVPIEPTYPDERLSYILQDTNAGIVLTNAKYQGRIQAFSAGAVIALDAAAYQAHLQLQAVGNPITAVTGKNLAYVIYTSGTTGKPNGVMIEHHSIINTLFSLAPVYQLTKNKRASAYTSYVFDVSVAEFFAVLIAGGELHLLDAERKDINQLSAYLLSHKINVAYLPPAVLSILPKVNYPALDVLIFAGEPFEQGAGQFWAINYKLYNYYGPTEFTIYCTGKRVNEKNINIIGRPINNSKAFVLNKDGNLVPMGTIGELHLSGVGIARGYLNNLDLTGKKFITNKFQLADEKRNDGYTRLYKTGDLVRWRPEGDLEFIQRNDSQVKINGYRIELSEIEAVLNSHPEVKQSVVLALEHKANCLSNLNANKYLVAYYVPNLAVNSNDEENHTKQWEKLYESEYGDLKPQEYRENTAGWKSSYTGAPFPKEEMHEWLDETLKRIISLKPNRVLEIGSGTGMLLFNLINYCQHYYATDFSEQAIRYTSEISRRLGFQDKVTCIKEESNKLPFPSLKEKYTSAILNSVIQYFPTLDYLEETLNNLIENITHPGTIFIGDVRDYRLLPCFHYSVLNFKNHPINAQAIDFFVKREKELTVSPNYFLYLKQINPKISHVELLPKLGLATNEMNLYRYDVILHIGKDSSYFEDIDYRQFLPITDLESYLSNNLPEIITFQYPNRKIAKEYIECNKVYGDQTNLNDHEINKLLTLNQIKQLLSRHSYEAHFYMSPEMPFTLNVVGFNKKRKNFKKVTISYKKELSLEHSNNPLLNMKLIKETNNQKIKKYLQDKLPYYMVPPHLVPLKELHLTPAGKLNLKALPDPYVSVSDNYFAPRDKQEREICTIFAELLGSPVEKVGIKDNFFDIGGNSLLAIALVGRLNKRFAVNLKICDIFKQENIANINELICLFLQENAVME